VPVFAGRQDDLVSAVLRNEAAKHRAPIQFLTEDFRAYREQDRMVFDADDVLLDLPCPALIGGYFKRANHRVLACTFAKSYDGSLR